MSLKLRNKTELSKYLLDYAGRFEGALLLGLGYMVAELENHAKLSAGYQNRTSNLQSSIGGVVLKDGAPIKYEGFKGTPSGKNTGKEFVDQLIGNFPTGYVLIVVAGMNYASYVENYYNLNVLKKSELKMNRELPLLLDKLKKKI